MDFPYQIAMFQHRVDDGEAYDDRLAGGLVPKQAGFTEALPEAACSRCGLLLEVKHNGHSHGHSHRNSLRR